MKVGTDGSQVPADVFHTKSLYSDENLQNIAEDLILQLQVAAGFLDFELAAPGDDPPGYLLEIRLEVNSNQTAHTTKFVLELKRNDAKNSGSWTMLAEFEDDLKSGTKIKEKALRERVSTEFAKHTGKPEFFDLFSNVNFLDYTETPQFRTWVHYVDADSTVVLPFHASDFRTTPKGLGLRLANKGRDRRTGKMKTYELELAPQTHADLIGNYDEDNEGLQLTDSDYEAWSAFFGVPYDTCFTVPPLRQHRLIGYVEGDHSALNKAFEDKEALKAFETGGDDAPIPQGVAKFSGLHVTRYKTFPYADELLERSPSEVFEGMKLFEANP